MNHEEITSACSASRSTAGLGGSFAPSVIVDGRTITPAGWMWVISFALAGYTDSDIAPMFADAPTNCHLPDGWRSNARVQAAAEGGRADRELVGRGRAVGRLEHRHAALDERAGEDARVPDHRRRVGGAALEPGEQPDRERRGLAGVVGSGQAGDGLLNTSPSPRDP